MEKATQTMEPEQTNSRNTPPPSAAPAPPGAPANAPATTPMAPLDAGGKNGEPKKKGGAKYFVMVSIVLIVAGLCGVGFWMYSQGREETDDAYIDGHITTVSSRIAGTVTQVFADDNQRVAFNAPLVKLDPRDYQTRVSQLQASLKQSQQQAKASESKIGQSELSSTGQLTQASAEKQSATAELDRAKASLLAAQDEQRQAESKVREEKAQLEYAHTDFERYRLVYEQRAVTKQSFDKAKENVTVAQAQLEGAEQALQQSKRKVLESEASIHESEAHLLRSEGSQVSAAASQKQPIIDQQQFQSQVASNEMAKSQLDEAMLQLSYCDINAPVAGIVGRKNVEVGQRVQVGQSLMAVVQDNYWVTANFKETQLNKMRVGQKAEVRIDSFPGKTFIGKIDSLSPASGAKFSLLPPDNATGNFTKVVQRVPVKIVFEQQSLGDYARRISPGMSCVVTVLFK